MTFLNIARELGNRFKQVATVAITDIKDAISENIIGDDQQEWILEQIEMAEKGMKLNLALVTSIHEMAPIAKPYFIKFDPQSVEGRGHMDFLRSELARLSINHHPRAAL